MPINPSYEWDETSDKIEVRVAVLGASRSKADVFATSCLLKVNSPPYLLMLDLHDMVDESKTIVTLSPEGVTFRLFKVCYSILELLCGYKDSVHSALMPAASKHH